MSNPLAKFLDADDLPSPPGVALRLLELYSQEDVEISEMAKVISVDPVLSSKLIDYCNSPILARTRLTSSVEQAVVLIGLRAVKMIGLSFSLMQTAPDNSNNFDYDQFWNKSLATAIAARTISSHLKGDKEMVFLMGLMLNIGQMAMAHVCGDEYLQATVEASRRSVPIAKIEMEKWTINHYELGAELLSDWKFPDEMTSVIRSFGLAEPDTCESARILLVAELMAEMLFNEEVHIDHVMAVKEIAKSSLGIAGQLFDKLFDESVVFWSEYAKVLSFDCSNALTFEKLERKARRGIAELSLGLQAENSQIKQENLQLKTNILVDSLTGLKNRRAYDSEANAELDRCKRSRSAFVMMVVDIDKFKTVNDTYGHSTGDAILIRVAETLIDHTRKYDSVFRVGGEEFVVVLAECDPRVAATVAERFRASVENLKIQINDHVHQVTASFGVCCVKACSHQSLEEIFNHADRLMYQAKSQGRNQCCFEMVEADEPNFLRSATAFDLTATLKSPMK